MPDATEQLQALTQSRSAQTPNQPSLCAEEALFHIDKQGEWFYQNSPLPAKFAKMFGTILHCVDGEYFLITPVEKVRVSVEAYPIVLVDYEARLLPVNHQQLAQDAQEMTANLLPKLLDFVSVTGAKYVEISFDDIHVADEHIEVQLSRGLTACMARACYYRYINQFILSD